MQGFWKLPWDKICPIVPAGTYPRCSVTEGGNCGKNQNGRGRISIGKYDQPGDTTDMDRCNPNLKDPIFKNALDGRIAVVNELKTKMCSQTGSIPRGDPLYLVAAKTLPCTILDNNHQFRLSCNIRCVDMKVVLNSFFKGAPRNGIGCLACCLMVHENEHCNQLGKGESLGTYETECEAFTKEAECLDRILKGGKCTA